jgi:hypothetical protein
MDSTGSSKKIPKSKATVTLKLTDGEMFEGHFFLSGDERVTDLLNGKAQYLPFETLNGAIFVINKVMIARVIARERATAEQGRVISPRNERW